MVFKGSAQEEAVLCTAKETYLVKDVETTNLIMLVRDPKSSMELSTVREPPGHVDSASQHQLEASANKADGEECQYAGRATQVDMLAQAHPNNPVVVNALVSAHLELSRIQPRLHTLDDLLCNTHLISEVGDNDANGIELDGKGISWCNLVECVQASPEELLDALEDANAVCLGGLWRGVSPEVNAMIMKLIVLTAIEKGYPFELMPTKDIATSLQEHGIPQMLTMQILHRACDKESLREAQLQTTTSRCVRELEHILSSAEQHHVPLSTGYVCKLIGVGLLLEQERWTTLDEFTTAWKRALPDAFEPSIDMLRGEILVQERPTGTMSHVTGMTHTTDTGVHWEVMKLSSFELPRDPEERFRELFSIKKEWTYGQIHPYIAQYAVGHTGDDPPEILLKFARQKQTTPKDPITYTSR